jgi:hypothetical protein
MSMPPPISADPSSSGDDVPAADPGTGAPPPSPGFGREGEEPDVQPDDDGAPDVAPRGETPFRTPDPEDVGPGSPG